ncbi:MAG: 4Fe-4S dicluster domain-containing protein [Bacteroidales bacterium]|jgi:formate dehydrogenase iron-sulfur subunit|nr:4Fe-4S dicluster domain-containing protein [Bacteroidales bacterium]
MGINRLNFFRVLGLTGVSLAFGKKLNASQPSHSKEKQKEFVGVLYDSTRCVGCQECEIVCAKEHGLPEPDPNDYPTTDVVRKTNENRRSVINAFDTSKGEVYTKKQCMHCGEPACGAACLTEAMHKTHEGPVIWRGDKCMGCRYCMISCPFDVPKFEYQSTNPEIVKCTMCNERLQEGGIPACVENCPAEALTFGTRKELLKEARKRIVENPDLYYDHIYGEHEAGGTEFLYLSPVPFKEIGFKTNLQNKSYPSLTKGFIGAIAPVDILLPAALLGIYEATKSNKKNTEDEE